MSAIAGRLTRTAGPIAELGRSRELLLNLTLREIRGKYKRTFFGHGWSLVNPLSLILIYTIVFGQFLVVNIAPGDPSGVDSFALFLTSALLPWMFFANALQAGMGAITSNANLVQRVHFPRQVLVAAGVLSWTVSFAIELAVLAVILTIAGASVWPWVPVIVLAMALLTLFAYGFALILSVANVYFRDTQHFIPILLQLWFFLTPIVYPISYVRDAANRLAAEGWDLPIDFIYRLNPMQRFTDVFRDLMYDNHWPSLADSLYCVGATAVLLIVGYAVFKRFEPRLAEEL